MASYKAHSLNTFSGTASLRLWAFPMNYSRSARGTLRVLHLTRLRNDWAILLNLTSLLAGTPKESAPSLL
jgi:hypothetical protein